MRKIAISSILLVILCLLFITACATKQNVEVEDAGPSGALLDVLAEMSYDEIVERYVDLVVRSGIASDSWQSVMEIDPDRLVYFYGYSMASVGLPDDGIIPQENLEPYVQQFFDVSTEQIRTSSLYYADGGYYQVDGMGGAGVIKLEEYWVKDNLAELTYGIYSEDGEDTYFWGGILTVQVDGESFRYISNSLE